MINEKNSNFTIQKSYYCNVCGNTFRSLPEIERHQNVHTRREKRLKSLQDMEDGVYSTINIGCKYLGGVKIGCMTFVKMGDCLYSLYQANQHHNICEMRLVVNNIDLLNVTKYPISLDSSIFHLVKDKDLSDKVYNIINRFDRLPKLGRSKCIDIKAI
jgi:hypothetical protein